MSRPTPTYHARFYGRTRGAIGIFHPCEAFVQGDDPKSARLTLYDDYEHISGLNLVELPIRYVPTYKHTDGTRRMMTAVQGRHTYATDTEANSWIEAVLNTETNSPETLRSLWGDDPQCEVRPVPCWPGYFDPIRSIFED